MTTIHHPPASAVLVVGVDLMTDLVPQRGHVSTNSLRSDLGTRHLEVATKSLIPERADVLATAVPMDRGSVHLRLYRDNSQIRDLAQFQPRGPSLYSKITTILAIRISIIYLYNKGSRLKSRKRAESC